MAREALVVARPRPMADPQPGRDIGMVWRKRAPQADAFRTVAAAIRGVLRREAPEVTAMEDDPAG